MTESDPIKDALRILLEDKVPDERAVLFVQCWLADRKDPVQAARHIVELRQALRL